MGLRCIHLNSLRARIVAQFKDLTKYRYCGHSVLLGKLQNEFQDIEYVLKQFGNKLSEARYNYREFVRKRIELGNRPELVGGGLLRSSGGWGVLKAMSKARIHLKGDERILGESDFVKEVLSEQDEKLNRRYWFRAQGYDMEKVVKRVAEVLKIDADVIWRPGNQPPRVRARSLTCFWAIRQLGMSGTSVGKLLGLGQPAVSRAVVRGDKISRDLNIKRID